MLYKATYFSPVGKITLASDGDNIIGLWLEGQKYYGGTLTEKCITRENIPVFLSAKAWLDKYFAGERPLIENLPLLPKGGEFRQNVWKLLCQIPYGEVVTYGDIARKMAVVTGQPKMSAQAVGGAVGHNPISIIIPCHRVVGTNGSLTGYAGGINWSVPRQHQRPVKILLESHPLTRQCRTLCHQHLKQPHLSSQLSMKRHEYYWLVHKQWLK